MSDMNDISRAESIARFCQISVHAPLSWVGTCRKMDIGTYLFNELINTVSS